MSNIAQRLLFSRLYYKNWTTSVIGIHNLTTFHSKLTPKFDLNKCIPSNSSTIRLYSSPPEVQTMADELDTFLWGGAKWLGQRKDSFDTAVIPLSSIAELQDRYTNVMGSVRTGRVLEDIDLFAVWLCLKHIDNPKAKTSLETPYTIVTVGVDHINFSTNRPKVTQDLRLSGSVIYSGRTSMEVCVKVETLYNGEWQMYTKAFFVMAARNSTNSGGAFVNKLVPDGDKEIEEHKLAQKRQARRQFEQKTSLLKNPPNADEQTIIHEKFMKTIDLSNPTLNRRVLPPNSEWMDSTKLSNTIYPHPENRNHHNTVFGGFLMRTASELSWMVAFHFATNRPYLVHISDFVFKAPVSINSFIKMSGAVIYSELNYVQVIVFCETFNILTREQTTTNIFNYTYEISNMAKEVVPSTYLDSINWISGRRHFQEAMGIAPPLN